MEGLANSDQVKPTGRGVKVLSPVDRPMDMAEAKALRLAPPHLDHVRLQIHSPNLGETVRDRQRHAPRPASQVQEARAWGQARILQKPLQHLARIGQPIASIVVGETGVGVWAKVGR